MSLLTDLLGYVTQFNTNNNTKYDTAANAILSSFDFQAVMISAAQQGKYYIQFPIQNATINGMYETIGDIKAIENNLIAKLVILYPGVKFYKDKHTTLKIFGQWKEYDPEVLGPIK